MKFPKLQDILLFSDDNLLVLNKPSGITTEGENAAGQVSLSDIVKKTYPEAMMVHRIDRETSGVILAARNSDTYRYLSVLFEKRKIAKEYRAITMGAHSFDNREINFPLSKKSNKAIVDHREGKKAETTVNTLKAYQHFTLVQAFPHSGRFHQIRVHLASIGAPLVGDELYGGKPFFLSSVKRKYHAGKNVEEQPVMDRSALHAFSLKFEYPEGQEFYLEAPYPKDFRVTLELLDKWDER
jgi:23S rRNA pseudouridine955/2504/2580 synthase